MFKRFFMKNSTDSKVKESEEILLFAYIPQIVVRNLKSNLKLLDDKTIQDIKEELAKEPYGRYSKSRFRIPYGIYYGKDGIFAIYNKNNRFYRLFASLGAQYRLGAGGSSYVKLAQNLETGEWKALKVNDLTYYPNVLFIEECRMLSQLGQTKDKKGIIRISKKDTYSVKGNVLMNLAPGNNLADTHDRRGTQYPECTWPDLIWLDIAMLAAEAVKELHQKNLYHLDIKADNLIWDLARRKITLIDFGLSRECKVDRVGDKIVQLKRLVGTLKYIAPELMFSKTAIRTYTEKTEIYALGILFQEILYNCRIWWDNVLKQNKVFLRKKSTKWLNDRTLGVRNLVESMLAINPKHRPTLDIVIKKLHEIRKSYILKYPKEDASCKFIYKKAEREEVERLRKIYKKQKVEKSEKNLRVKFA